MQSSEVTARIRELTEIAKTMSADESMSNRAKSDVCNMRMMVLFQFYHHIPHLPLSLYIFLCYKYVNHRLTWSYRSICLVMVFISQLLTTLKWLSSHEETMCTTHSTLRFVLW